MSKTTQAQITKPASKTAAPRTGKGKGKTDAAPKTEQATQEAPKGIAFAIVDYARPKAGAALFAHTAAFLELSGMNAGQAYPKSKAVQVIGQTAVKYHAGNGNIEQTAEGVKLTDKGRAFFAARPAVDKELHAAFVEVMTEGKVNDKANVKAESSRVAIK